MNFLKRTLWVAVATAAVAVAGSASAQTIGGLGGTTGTGGGTTGGGGGGFGGSTGGGGGSSGTGGASTTVGSSGTGAINLTPPSSYAQAPQSVATSNNLAKFYANPYYQGRAGVTTSSYIAVVNPGGFGAPIYGTTFGAAQNTTGGGRGGAAGGFGGATGAGGGGFGTSTGGNARGGAVGGLNSGGTSQNAQVVNPGVVGISYTATIKFATRAVTPAEFQANVQNVINRTSAVSNPAAIQVLTGPNGGVTLRGRARDEDEARAAENMLRLTPGVHDVRNELTYPKQ